jgi:hypothetical protein
MVIEAKRLAAIHSDFVIAAAAIHRSAISGLKGYLGLDAAFSTYGSEHLAIRRSGTTKSARSARAIALRPLCLTARRASLGLIGIPLNCKELLLFDAECEATSTICALKRFVHWAHWMTSFLLIVG